MNVLLGVTGSVASKLTPKIAKEFANSGHEVEIITTESAKHFYDKDDMRLFRVWDDKEEFPLRSDRVNDDGTMFIPHIHLKDWADVFVIAPLTANTLAKISHGFADNLLTCTFRAWNIEKPIVLAPAMNTDMWEHPMTEKCFYDLHEAGFNLYSTPFSFDNKASNQQGDIFMAPPVAKKLACGQEGVGALASISDIVDLVNKLG